jgi:hypothetical protein
MNPAKINPDEFVHAVGFDREQFGGADDPEATTITPRIKRMNPVAKIVVPTVFSEGLSVLNHLGGFA